LRSTAGVGSTFTVRLPVPLTADLASGDRALDVPTR